MVLGQLNLDPCFTRYTKINSKWIIALILRAKSIKTLENRGEKFLRFWFRQRIFRYYKALIRKEKKKEKTINWTSSKPKTFLCFKRHLKKKNPSQVTDLKKILVNHTFNKRLVFKICKELLHSIIRIQLKTEQMI